MDNILNSYLNFYREKFKRNKGNLFISNSISNNPIDKVLLNRDLIKKKNTTFTNSIYYNKKVTNQNQSGRCWLFAFTNLLRHKLIKEHNLREDFQLSQNYLSFYDKIEKAQYFMQIMYQKKHLKIYDRQIKYFLEEPITDGGFWNMACNLVEKYGVIPKENMQETFQSSHSKQLNFILNKYLRRFAFSIRKNDFSNETFNIFLKDKLFIIYRILVYFLGEPPVKFDWEYYLEGKKPTKNIKKNLTPLTFLKDFVGFNSDNYYILLNLPMNDFPFYKKYKMKYCNNMINGRTAEFINVPINDFINTVKKSIDNELPVWFGSDVHHFIDKQHGIADRELYDYDIFDNSETQELDKGDRILFNQSSPNHAMLILGYDYKDDTIQKWLIENSWGPKKGIDGYLSMSYEWFKEYAFEIVVEKKVLSDKTIDVLHSKKITEIVPWRIFSCEALCVQ